MVGELSKRHPRIRILSPIFPNSFFLCLLRAPPTLWLFVFFVLVDGQKYKQRVPCVFCSCCTCRGKKGKDTKGISHLTKIQQTPHQPTASNNGDKKERRKKKERKQRETATGNALLAPSLPCSLVLLLLRSKPTNPSSLFLLFSLKRKRKPRGEVCLGFRSFLFLFPFVFCLSFICSSFLFR